MALLSKFIDEQVTLLNELSIAEPKTKAIAGMLKSLGLVWIPGVMAGMMVSGANPLYAGLFQFVVVAMIILLQIYIGIAARSGC